MKIFGWSANFDGCYHYRMLLPLGHLKLDGHEVSINHKLPTWWRDEAAWADLDVFVGQRVVNAGPSAVWHAVARLPNRPLMVYEVDDDLFQVDPSSQDASRAFNRAESRETMAANMRVADLVTVSTPYLAEVASKFNPNVAVLPNYIGQEVLQLGIWRRETGKAFPDDSTEMIAAAKELDGAAVAFPAAIVPPTVVGWAGSGTHEMDLQFWARPIRKVLDRFPVPEGPAQTKYIRLASIGADTRAVLGRPGDFYLPWQRNLYRHYAAVCSSLDVGLAPLRPHVFNRSKSHVKALEYAALGIPSICSMSEPYAGFVEHGVTGFLPSKASEWVECLTALVTDDGLRDRMSSAALEQASKWLMADHVHEWVDVYEKARTVGVA